MVFNDRVRRFELPVFTGNFESAQLPSVSNFQSLIRMGKPDDQLAAVPFDRLVDRTTMR